MNSDASEAALGVIRLENHLIHRATHPQVRQRTGRPAGVWCSRGCP